MPPLPKPAVKNARHQRSISALIILTSCTPLLTNPMHHYWGVSYFAAPLLVLLAWAPYLIWNAVRRWQVAAQEKQALQAKYDAEDIAMFGRKLDLQ
jgi:hypothetical protein